MLALSGVESVAAGKVRSTTRAFHLQSLQSETCDSNLPKPTTRNTQTEYSIQPCLLQLVFNLALKLCHLERNPKTGKLKTLSRHTTDVLMCSYILAFTWTFGLQLARLKTQNFLSRFGFTADPTQLAALHTLCMTAATWPTQAQLL